MHRVFDFTPAEPEIVVSRVLVDLHQAIDESFPHARPASQRFAKTDFVGSDEPTLTQLMPGEPPKEAANNALRDTTAENHGTPASFSNPPQKSRPSAQSIHPTPMFDEEPNQEVKEWQTNRGMPVKQTIIGILALILVALLAYLLSRE